MRNAFARSRRRGAPDGRPRSVSRSRWPSGNAPRRVEEFLPGVNARRPWPRLRARATEVHDREAAPELGALDEPPVGETELSACRSRAPPRAVPRPPRRAGCLRVRCSWRDHHGTARTSCCASTLRATKGRRRPCSKGERAGSRRSSSSSLQREVVRRAVSCSIERCSTRHAAAAGGTSRHSPCSRRRWRTELSDCRLQTLERQICWRRRSGDVPSDEVPPSTTISCAGRPLSLVPIFHHNMLDVITMASCASCALPSGSAVRAMAGPSGFARGGPLALRSVSGATGAAGSATARYTRIVDTS